MLLPTRQPTFNTCVGCGGRRLARGMQPAFWFFFQGTRSAQRVHALHRALRMQLLIRRCAWPQGVYVFYLELLTDMLHLFVYIVFFIIVFTHYGLPLHLARALVLAGGSMCTRVAARAGGPLPGLASACELRYQETCRAGARSGMSRVSFSSQALGRGRSACLRTTLLCVVPTEAVYSLTKGCVLASPLLLRTSGWVSPSPWQPHESVDDVPFWSNWTILAARRTLRRGVEPCRRMRVMNCILTARRSPEKTPLASPQVRDLYWTARNFRNRVADFLRYRRVTANMDERFADATEADLARADGAGRMNPSR